MNIETIKSNIKLLAGLPVLLKVNIGRNKHEIIEGTISETYPILFTIKTNEETKSFTYSDILTKTVVIKRI